MLPHDRIAVDIACNGRLPGGGVKECAIVFAATGIPHDSNTALEEQEREEAIRVRRVDLAQ